MPVASAPANGISLPAILHELYDFSTVLCDCVVESILKLNVNEVKLIPECYKEILVYIY